MTTTTVRKGSGRPAATARRTKAAHETRPAAKAAAAAKPGPARRAARKAADVWLADAVEEAASAAAKPTQEKATKATGNKETKPESHPERRADSGPGKAARLTAALRPAGWTVKIKTQGERIEATAKRGKESLVMVFVRGGFDYGSSSYANDGNSRKVRNVSEAIRLWGQTEA